MQTHSKIAVAGATGRVGRHVVEVLEEAGHTSSGCPDPACVCRKIPD
jgi:nucleoside-diphosphate-sugar epimerase